MDLARPVSSGHSPVLVAKEPPSRPLRVMRGDRALRQPSPAVAEYLYGKSPERLEFEFGRANQFLFLFRLLACIAP